MERIKLSFLEPRYFVNPNKRSVICKLQSYIKFPDSVLNRFGDDLYKYGLCCDMIETCDMTVCDPGDKWDLSLGKHIAESKAKKLAYREASRRMRAFIKSLKPTLDSMITFEDNMEELSAYEIEHLGELSK